jgi:hypothetical protein
MSTDIPALPDEMGEHRRAVEKDVAAERLRQFAKWGWQKARGTFLARGLFRGAWRSGQGDDFSRPRPSGADLQRVDSTGCFRFSGGASVPLREGIMDEHPKPCKKHPKYQAWRAPRCECRDCWWLWYLKNRQLSFQAWRESDRSAKQAKDLEMVAREAFKHFTAAHDS